MDSCRSSLLIISADHMSSNLARMVSFSLVSVAGKLENERK